MPAELGLTEVIAAVASLFVGAGATRGIYHRKISSNGNSDKELLDKIDNLDTKINDKIDGLDDKVENKFELVFKVIGKNEKKEDDRNRELTEKYNKINNNLTGFKATIETAQTFKDEKVDKLEKTYDQIKTDLGMIRASHDNCHVCNKK